MVPSVKISPEYRLLNNKNLFTGHKIEMVLNNKRVLNDEYLMNEKQVKRTFFLQAKKNNFVALSSVVFSPYFEGCQFHFIVIQGAEET